MALTFTHYEGPKVYNHFKKKINMDCPFCKQHVDKYNFGGVFLFGGHARPIHKTIQCVMTLIIHRRIEAMIRRDNV